MGETFSFELSRKTKKGFTSLKKGNQMISANDRLHHHVRATITSYLRQLPHRYSWDEPRYTKERPCIVTIDVHPPTRRRMDAPNWYPTVKALIDGFVDAGLLTDDNNKIITETRFKSTALSGTKNYILNMTFEEVELDA